MSNSALVTGCIDSRLPFLITIISSRPFVAFRVSSETTAGKRSTKATSTMYHVGDSGVPAASKYLWPFFQAK